MSYIVEIKVKGAEKSLGIFLQVSFLRQNSLHDYMLMTSGYCFGFSHKDSYMLLLEHFQNSYNFLKN